MSRLLLRDQINRSERKFFQCLNYRPSLVLSVVYVTICLQNGFKSTINSIENIMDSHWHKVGYRVDHKTILITLQFDFS